MRRCLSIALPIAFLVILGPLAGQAQYGFPFRRWDKPAPTAPVDWYAANGSLSIELRTAAIGDLAQRALRDPMPHTAAGWLRRLALLVRAGYRQDALAMLKSRPRFLDARRNWNLNVLASEAAVTYQFPELARSICERFPEEGYGRQTMDVVLRTMPPKTVDAWLARQGMKANGQWFIARLQWRAKDGTAHVLIAPMERRVRAHPDDLAAVGEYLWAVQQCPEPVERAWLGTVCKPRLASQSLMLGQQFSLAGIDAIPLYHRALQTPFRDQDPIWYDDFLKHSGSAIAGTHFGLTEKQLRLWTKTALMEAYKKSGQIARAQALLEELTAQNPDGLPDLSQAFGAGQTQGASGAHGVEAHIRAAEKRPENRNSPDYWLERALYYSGRKEDGPAVEAFERALKLSPLPKDNTPSRRWDVVEAYQRHLWMRGNLDNPVEAVALLRREIALAPPESDYAAGLMIQIDQYETERTNFITPNDPQLWTLLAAQTEWARFGALLSHLVSHTPLEERDRLWARFENLARQGSVSRAYVLGQSELYSNAPQRAIPLLEQALPRTLDSQHQWELLRTLWEAQSRVNDWRGMQATGPRLAAVVGPTFSITDSWREMAVAAARSGARQEAMRFFRLWANQDRRPISLFVRSNYGIDAEIQTYLQQIKTAEPHTIFLNYRSHETSGGFPGRPGRGPAGPAGRE